jgi:hypothetical protein
MRGLPIKVKEHIEKARDSAILAVEIYNKPAVKFKSGGYISLMVIAWSSLFHAVFFNPNHAIAPSRRALFYREKRIEELYPKGEA